MPRSRCTGDLVPLTVAVLARTALLTWLLMATWALVASAAGAETTTVVSDSMSPALLRGDVVAVVPRDTEDLAPGQVLLVADPDHAERLRLHRLQEVADDGLRLRGDANEQADGSLVRPAAVHGVGVLRFPTVGIVTVWVRDRDAAGVLLGLTVVLVLTALAGADRAVRAGAPCRRCHAPRAVSVGAASSARTPLLLTALAVGLVAASVAPSVAGAAFTASTSGTGSLASAAAYPCFRTALDDPVLAWDFDEPRGTTVIDHAGGPAAEMYGAVARADRSCAENPFAQFLESGDSPRVVSSGRGTSPSAFSSEVWFRTDRAQGVLVSFGSDTSPASSFKDRILYVRQDGRLAFGVQSSSSTRWTVSSPQVVADGAWHHVVATASRSKLQLWVDGTLVAERSDTGATFSYTGSWRVGRQSVADWPSSSSALYIGDLDTVRIHDRVLTAAEIAAHHAAGR